MAAVLVGLAGCGSSSNGASSPTSAAGSSATSGGTTASSSGSAGTGNGKTITLGVLTDLTGVSAAGFLTFPKGVQAGIGVAGTEGYHFKYVLADTGSSPQGALIAAQRLVQQDHVFAVLGESSFFFAAAPFLASHGVPVIGADVDANEWLTDRNMFSIDGAEDFTKIFTQYGLSFKKLGVTNLAAVGYAIPSSTDAAKGAAVSAQMAGIKVGYLNTTLSVGSTNVGPIVLAMKNAGVDGLDPAIITNSAFAIIDGMRQQGAPLKAAILAEGYGGDLAAGGPDAAGEAQGLYFLSAYEPVEMHTAATEKLQSALQTYAGVTGDPTSAEYYAYLSVDAVVQGLKAAGANATQASFINAMLAMTNYPATGLYDGHGVDFSMAGRGQTAAPGNCWWVTQYQGSTFHVIPGLDPVCGETVPGKKVS